MRWTRWLALPIALACSPALADAVTLRNGRTFEGEIVRDTAREVRLKIRGGELTFPKHMVAEVELCARPQEAYAERYAAVDKSDPQALEALSLWARRLGLVKEADSLHAQALGVRLDALVAEARTRKHARYWLVAFEWGVRNGISDQSLRWLLAQAEQHPGDDERLARAHATLRTELAKRARVAARQRPPSEPRHYPKYEEDPDRVANIRRERQAMRQTRGEPSGRIEIGGSR